MTRRDLAKSLTKLGFSTRQANVLVTVVLDVLKKELLTSKVLELPFGTLEVKPSPPRKRLWRLDKIVTQHRAKNRVTFRSRKDWDK